MISTIKAVAGPAVKRALGLLDRSRRSVRDSLTVLLYHEVSEHPGPFMDSPSLNVPPELFARQMRFIADNFNVINPDQLVEGDFQRPAVLVSFDDGMLGYFRNAVPIMTQMKIPSINFLNMDTIEGDPSWAALATYLVEAEPGFQKMLEQRGLAAPVQVTVIPRAIVREYLASVSEDDLFGRIREYSGPIATASDLAETQEDEYVYLGNHLANHYSALTLDPTELAAAYTSNQCRLNALTNARPLFAYPHGRYRQGQNELLRSLGASVLFYSSEGINRDVSDPFYNRLSMDARMTCLADLVGQIRWVEFRRSMNWDYRGDPAGH